MKLELIPVVRYWDYNPKEILSALQKLKDNGVGTVAAWVPWSQLETDRLHLLQKFVRHSAAVGLKLQLGVTPELGIGYANGGIPDDILRDKQNYAQDRLGHTIYACVPPNIHPMVSLLAPNVFHRYGHFLLKLVQELSEVFNDGQGEVELLITDSLFKHYKNTGLAPADHGDYSLRHMEFGGGYKKDEWTPALAEKIFHSRAYDFLESRFRKYRHVKVVTKNVFARDCSLSRLLEEMVDSGPNHGDIFNALTKSRSSCSIAWLDDLHQLRDREKNFVVSTSLLLYGEVWLNDQDYHSLTAGFKNKMKKLVSGFSTDETTVPRPALCFVQNRFAPTKTSQLLQEKLGIALKFKSSLGDMTQLERETAKLFAVEEGYQLELRQAMDLLSLARERDCTLVIFRSSLCESGLREFRKLKTFRLNHGWLFEIGVFPEGGHVLLIEGQEHSQISMDTLGDSLVSVARIEPFCSFDKQNSGIFSFAVDWNLKDESEMEKSKGDMKTLFLMNPGVEAKKCTLEFAGQVRIHGLKTGAGASAETDEEAYGKCFETELPPLSVIPLSVFVEKAESEIERDSNGTQAELA